MMGANIPDLYTLTESSNPYGSVVDGEDAISDLSSSMKESLKYIDD